MPSASSLFRQQMPEQDVDHQYLEALSPETWQPLLENGANSGVHTARIRVIQPLTVMIPGDHEVSMKRA
jgi:hypothetical protein